MKKEDVHKYAPTILNAAERSTSMVSDGMECRHLEEFYSMCLETRVESSAKAHWHVVLNVGNQQEALLKELLQNGFREQIMISRLMA